MTPMTERQAVITEAMRELLMLSRQLPPDPPDWDRREPLIQAFSMLTAAGKAGESDRMDSMWGLLTVFEQEGLNDG